LENIVYGEADEPDDNAPGAQDAEVIGPGIEEVTSADQSRDVCNSTMCLTFLKQLKHLAAVSVTKCTTPKCTCVPEIKERFVGSALYLRWVRKKEAIFCFICLFVFFLAVHCSRIGLL
jgi:hypothetical protein